MSDKSKGIDLEGMFKRIRRDNEYKLVEARVHSVLIKAYEMFCKKTANKKSITFEEFLEMTLHEINNI